MVAADLDQVSAQFVKAFLREPLGGWMGVTKTEGDYIASTAIPDKVSFVVVDTRRPKGADIIAFRASKLLYRAEMEEIAATPPTDHPVPAILDHLMLTWYKESAIFKKNPNAKILKFMALGVNDEYEGMGLAKELLQASMEKAKELQCDGVMVIATAFATQHLFANRLHFDRVTQLRYEDYEFCGNGGRTYPFQGLQPEIVQVFEKKLY
ncbi:hypothetical protein DFQ27_004508 [Actinomortierella ambigua]|uniref:N-acetyltransferase domain-containing protein n=1 Tax=Actinomortierella ambigua TaxID=1343610 RepID=A0A9P6U3B0_9FUNG|nr:hypothetical protein DFQ27_004508 [Actinomortierella ambigua]